MAQTRKPRLVTTDKQRKAARRNGARSTGPQSGEGKQRSSQNALRHGLTSELVTLTIEDRPLFDRLLALYIQEFQPQTEFEHDLVEEMAVAKWRQRRTWAFQTAIIDARIERIADRVKQEFETIDTATIGALAFAEEADNSASLTLMQRYESMHARHFRRAWKDLQSRAAAPKQKLRNEPDKDLTPPDSTTGSSDEIISTPTPPRFRAPQPSEPQSIGALVTRHSSLATRSSPLATDRSPAVYSRTMKHPYLLILATLAATLVSAQPRSGPLPVELLWPAGAPGAVGSEDADKPAFTIYLADPAKAIGTGVVVCPGGGYGALAMDHEGKQIATWLNGLGVSAFVLKYRLGPRYHHPAMMQDVQQAMRLVRAHSGEYHIRPDRIGVWGFSAGGHLASTAATHFETRDGVSSRPDFAILSYPVITMKDPFTHKGSRRNLLGENPDPALVELMSNETQVTAQTPPSFIFFTTDDNAVPVENGVMFYQALHKAGVPAEMHIFATGPHGVGLAPDNPALSWWPKLLIEWLRGRGLLSK